MFEESTLKEDIKSLRELQAIDIQVLNIDEEMAASTAELEKRETTIEERKTTIATLADRIEGADVRRRELEAEIEDSVDRIKDRQTKLMNVQTNREYQSLLKEIDEIKKGNKQKEDEVVRLMEQVEVLKVSQEEQSTLCEAEEKLLNEELARIKKANKTLNSEKTKILKSRDAKAKKVKAGALRKYDILREKRNGMAVVRVSRGVCHGCYMNLPPQLYNELMKEEKLLTCPTCNRMIFYMAEED